MLFASGTNVYALALAIKMDISSICLPFFIEIGSYLTDTGQKISWHVFETWCNNNNIIRGYLHSYSAITALLPQQRSFSRKANSSTVLPTARFFAAEMSALKTGTRVDINRKHVSFCSVCANTLRITCSSLCTANVSK